MGKHNRTFCHIVNFVNLFSKISFIILLILLILNDFFIRIDLVDALHTTPFIVLFLYLVARYLPFGIACVAFSFESKSSKKWGGMMKIAIYFLIIASLLFFSEISVLGLIVMIWVTSGFALFAKKKWENIFPNE